jgi:hypothetical protein
LKIGDKKSLLKNLKIALVLNAVKDIYKPIFWQVVTKIIRGYGGHSVILLSS